MNIDEAVKKSQALRDHFEKMNRWKDRQKDLGMDFHSGSGIYGQETKWKEDP